jgi:hypothetical protein
MNIALGPDAVAGGRMQRSNIPDSSPGLKLGVPEASANIAISSKRPTPVKPSPGVTYSGAIGAVAPPGVR